MNNQVLGANMGTVVKCVCGVSIDITGVTPRKSGTKVWCRVCGATTIHHHDR